MLCHSSAAHLLYTFSKPTYLGHLQFQSLVSLCRVRLIKSQIPTSHSPFSLALLCLWALRSVGHYYEGSGNRGKVGGCHDTIERRNRIEYGDSEDFCKYMFVYHSHVVRVEDFLRVEDFTRGGLYARDVRASLVSRREVTHHQPDGAASKL